MDYYKLEVFIPVEHVKPIVKALNEAGFIREGDYDYCYATSLVKGHFRALEGAKPFIGSKHEVVEVDEIKLECRIPAERRTEVEAIVRLAHPYEVPVMNFIVLAN